MIFRHFFSGLVHFSILGIAGVSFLGKCRLPNKNDWRLEATGEKTNEPGKRKNQLLRRIDLYRDLEEKHTHIYAYNCIFTNASIYIYCIILYTHMRLWYYLAPAKHWHRKVFPRTFQRARRIRPRPLTWHSHLLWGNGEAGMGFLKARCLFLSFFGNVANYSSILL